MEPTTKEELDYAAGNQLIAEFMGYEKVRLGYWGSEEWEGDESEWQLKHKELIDEMGIENVGIYFVNVTTKKWVDEKDLNYNQDWNKLMEVWIKIRELDIIDDKGQFHHSWHKQNISTQISYGTIETSYTAIINFIKWYNSTKQV